MNRRERAANAVAPLVAMLIEALTPIFIELRNVPHELARVYRVYREKRRHERG